MRFVLPGRKHMKHPTRQRIYVGTFVSLVLLFVGAMVVKQYYEDLKIEERMHVSVLEDFPVQAMSRLRPFIDDVLLPWYSHGISTPPKQALPRTKCTVLINKLLEDFIEYSEKKSDSAFSQIAFGLESLNGNECSGAPIQCARVGMPKALIAILLLAPFPPNSFKYANYVFLADPALKSDTLLNFLATLRMPRISTDVIKYTNYVETFINGSNTWNLLGLKSDMTLPSSETEIVVPLPPSCFQVGWKFEHDVSSRLHGSPLSLTVNMPWKEDRHPFTLRQALNFNNHWYVLMSAELNIDGKVAKVVFDRELQFWTMIRPDGRVQTIGQYFGLKFISTFVTKMNFNKL